MRNVEIYTDGACSGNPGPGGWGAILMYNGHEKEISGALAHTTNNRMELLAAIEALQILKEPCTVKIYSDSAYMCNAFNKRWLDTWQRNGWQTSKKQPVENDDLWKRLLELRQTHSLTLIKVAGHSNNDYNNRCDTLARKAIVDMRRRKKDGYPPTTMR